MYKLHQYVNGKFNNVINAALIDFPGLIQCSFDAKRLTTFNSLKDRHLAYNGYNACGPTSYVISPYIKHAFPHLKQKLGYTRVGSGRHEENHIFLILKDNDGTNIIVDPSYKQFLLNGALNQNKTYDYELYEKLPPFFVGSYADLEKTVYRIIRLQEKLTGDTLVNKETDILSWWNGHHVPPFSNDLYDLINNPHKLEHKSDIIKNIVKVITEDLRK